MTAHLPDHPYDVTVMPSPKGYLIGRVLPSKPHGPWWEYLETVLDLQSALTRARFLARAHRGHAWFLGDKARKIFDPDAAAEAW